MRERAHTKKYEFVGEKDNKGIIIDNCLLRDKYNILNLLER